MRVRVFIFGFLLACFGGRLTVQGAVTFTNAPTVVATTYNGPITLLISGLTNNEPVVIQKYLDVNTNGVIDVPDILVQRFNLTEGKAAVFGAITTITPAVTNVSGNVTNITPAVTNYSAGFTNINVPGDFGSVTGQIATTIDFQNQDIAQKLVGQYLYRMGSPSSHFPAVTNEFIVTNAPLTQAFTGHVICNSTNVPGAFVLLFTRAGDGGLISQTGTVSDNSGGYQINAAPGTYLLLAGKSNFVADTTTAPVLTLASNAALDADLNLIAATQSISGRLIESGYSGYLLTNFTYGITSLGNQYGSSNLTYSYTVYSSTCAYFQNVVASGVSVSAPITTTTLVQIKGKTWYAAPTTYVNGNYLTTLTRAFANDQVCVGQGYSVFPGDVLEDQTSPVGVPGTLLFAQSTNGLLGIAFTDNNSNFVARVTSGRWVVSPDATALQVHGDLKFQSDSTNNTTGGNVSGVTITVPKANAFIYGTVASGSGQPFGGVLMYGSDTNHQYELTGLRTATNGTYIAGAIAGTWRLQVSTNNPSLNGFVVLPPHFQTNLIAGQAILQNFVAQTSTNLLSNFQFTVPQQFSFNFIGNIGANYAAQYATDLAAPVWTTFQTFQLTTNPFTITDSNATSTPRFYRVINVP